MTWGQGLSLSKAESFYVNRFVKPLDGLPLASWQDGRAAYGSRGLSGERMGFREKEKIDHKWDPHVWIFLFPPQINRDSCTTQLLRAFMSVSFCGLVCWRVMSGGVISCINDLSGHKKAHKSGWDFGYHKEMSYSWAIQILFHFLPTKQKDFCM